MAVKASALISLIRVDDGAKGDRGPTGAPGSPGKDGTSVTITSQAITYQASSSGTTIPNGTWVANPPSVAKGHYLWTRTVVNYSDGKKTTAYSVGYQGTNGQNGQNGSPGKDGATGPAGRGIKSTSITYQAWANGTSTPSGAWVTDPPKTAKDKPYLWTRTVITYTDNSTSTSYSVGSTIEGVQEDINSAKNAASVAQRTADDAASAAKQANGEITNINGTLSTTGESIKTLDGKIDGVITTNKQMQTDASLLAEVANRADTNAYNTMTSFNALNQCFYADPTGVHIKQSGTTNETIVTASGVEIIADDVKVAEFTKTQGRVSNLVADKFLYVGAHRLEELTQDGEVGTGFFWTGGAL